MLCWLIDDVMVGGVGFDLKVFLVLMEILL